VDALGDRFGAGGLDRRQPVGEYRGRLLIARYVISIEAE
jgi:hypothetical protein